jgi:two-component system response regulator AtoC
VSASTVSVLVVDDDASWRAVLAGWLQQEGFRVVGISRGDWVTSAVETQAADIVILDVQLPGLGGLDVLRALRTRWPDLPVIVTTAFGGPDTEDLARQRGATGYLEKPFRIGELMAEVRRATKAGA